MCAEKDLPLHLHDDKRLEEPTSGVCNHLLCVSCVFFPMKFLMFAPMFALGALKILCGIGLEVVPYSK